ncbi:tRNA (cytosine(32)/uridine(32)-2'-O)-methyltransferase TrmJ [Actinobacillus delphinicola]|uniref:tRNA (cytosine(32)/uridine(32)-2'-O)-methyltransferase TrmJ n=1 Tax=Actinobacillus delphinicola TaxID=51161 RepID=UPI00244231CC|nr:tRNA (cytosine(32)/uridine(32)-2'-O)-methyltransferase TrmJ [Actinobacillus delphinicola]MDG6897532.1 tRNA (cytosine(32)/uridine(32)-2'-O)-methyltransferase TrmJ [Actinobacillus delphinicola]
MLNQIRIILVETSHSGNIGSSARAMKTMGLTKLRLVAPQCDIDEQAVALSAGAEDVLKQAEIFSCFDEAIADCDLVIGTSARLRHLQNTLVDPKDCGEKVMAYLHQNPEAKIALVFGRERVGLTNEELLKCRYHLYVPTNPDYGSLNLAMAVQLACYELRQAWLKAGDDYQLGKTTHKDMRIYPKAADFAYFFKQTETLYRELGFIKNDGVMQKLQHLYQRADLDKAELNLLCGMLSIVQKKLND